MSKSKSNRSRSRVYKIVEVENKGMGMVATRNLKRGELIVAESPVLDTSLFNERVALSKDERKVLNHLPDERNFSWAGPEVSLRRSAQQLKHAFSQLGQRDQKRILNLSDAFMSFSNDVKTIAGVFATNFLKKGEGQPHNILCLTVSRFNHSCRPNITFVWVEPYQRIYTNCDIKKGEELCASYGGIYQAVTERKVYLSKCFRFSCICEACNIASGPDLVDSNIRRKRIAELDQLICKVGALNPVEGLRLVDEVVNLLKLEKLANPSSIGRYSYDAYRFSCGIGDLTSAKKWIKKAHANYLIIEGPKSEKTQDMARYLKNPKSHFNWGASFSGSFVDLKTLINMMGNEP